GEVHLGSGKVHCQGVGPDRYVAEVKSSGRIYHHESLAPDEYLGKVEGMHSLAEGGAALLLLLLPAFEGAAIEAESVAMSETRKVKE
ncbi:MAG: hypothetical protein SXV54_02075, partial [Chloroflexota bacterium]|nr:hypothetical protein [Chloroflexota bacterium]